MQLDIVYYHYLLGTIFPESRPVGNGFTSRGKHSDQAAKKPYLCTVILETPGLSLVMIAADDKLSLVAGDSNTHFQTLKYLHTIMSNETQKDTWRWVINLIASVLTALAAALGTTSCVAAL